MLCAICEAIHTRNGILIWLFPLALGRPMPPGNGMVTGWFLYAIVRIWNSNGKYTITLHTSYCFSGMAYFCLKFEERKQFCEKHQSYSQNIPFSVVHLLLTLIVPAWMINYIHCEIWHYLSITPAQADISLFCNNYSILGGWIRMY